MRARLRKIQLDLIMRLCYWLHLNGRSKIIEGECVETFGPLLTRYYIANNRRLFQFHIGSIQATHREWGFKTDSGWIPWHKYSVRKSC